MQSLNTMRAILVGCAVIAAIVAAGLGMWTVVLVLTVGIAAHAAMWVYVHRMGTHPTVRRTTADHQRATPIRRR